MDFSNTTTNDGLLQDAEFVLFGDNGFGRITGDSNRLKAFTGLINRALDKVTSLILASDGRWEFDDTNYTDLPIGVSTLVNNQPDYSLSVEHLRVLRVEILNNQGVYTKLDPIDINDIQYQGMTEFLNGAGTPLYYDIQGGSVFLYPKPQTGYVTMLSGLKVYFQRQPSYFVSTDTTKKPGFSTIFHRLVSRWACYDYALARQLPIKKDIRDEITVMENELKDFYATRDPDDSVGIRTKRYIWR
jgi:hypothetical protein